MASICSAVMLEERRCCSSFCNYMLRRSYGVTLGGRKDIISFSFAINMDSLNN